MEMISIQNYIQYKLDRNNIYIKLLEKQNKLLSKEIIVNYKSMLCNEEKVKLFNQINEIEKKQINNFYEELDLETVNLYQKINNTLLPPTYIMMYKEIDILKKECIELLNQLDILNRKIEQSKNILID
jgi:hypothetical protein